MAMAHRYSWLGLPGCRRRREIVFRALQCGIVEEVGVSIRRACVPDLNENQIARVNSWRADPCFVERVPFDPRRIEACGCATAAVGIDFDPSLQDIIRAKAVDAGPLRGKIPPPVT